MDSDRETAMDIPDFNLSSVDNSEGILLANHEVPTELAKIEQRSDLDGETVPTATSNHLLAAEEMMSTTEIDLSSMINDSGVNQDEGSFDASANAGILHLQGAKSTQSRCFVCQSKEGRKAVPWTAIQQAWFQKLAYIPKSNRICEDHLTVSDLFDEEALQKIEESKQCVPVKSEELKTWLYKISDLPQTTIYNFEEDGIESEKYNMFFGISKQNFDHLVQYLHGRIDG